jgi:hypothetical protein
MTWQEWLDGFVLLAGLNDRQRLTAGVWVRDVFAHGGVTPGELHAAALVVARRGPPSFVNEWLPALLDAVRQSRTDDLLAREQQERQGAEVGPGPCAFCDGTGLAIVPHHPQPPDAVRSGRLATHAVSCACNAGLRAAQLCINHRGEALMALAAYAKENPGWLDQRREHERQALAKARIDDSTREWSALVDRVARKAARR